MATFSPPTDNTVGPITDYFGNIPPEADPLMIRLMSHYRPTARGRNVYAMADGSFSETQPANWDPNDPTGPYAYVYTYAGGVNPPTGVQSFTLPPAQQVIRVYWGGCANPITAAEATALTAAGYTVTP